MAEVGVETRGRGELGNELSHSHAAAFRTNLIIAVCALLASLVIHIYGSRQCPNVDPLWYGMYSRSFLSGMSLYDEVVLDKPVLPVFIYAIPQLIAGREYWAMKVMLWLAIAAQVFMLIWFVRPAVLPGAAATLFLCFMPFAELNWEWPSTDHFGGVAALGTLLVARGHWLRRSMSFNAAAGMGALVALCYLIRPLTAPIVVVPLYVMASIGFPWRVLAQRVIVYAVSGLAAVALSVVVVAFLGSYERYLFVLFVYPRIYATTPSAQSPEWWWHMTGPTGLLVAILLALVAAKSSLTPRLLLICLVSGFLSVFAGMIPSGHYVINMFPAIALSIAGGRDAFKPPSAPAFRFAAILFAVLAGFLAINTARHLSAVSKAESLESLKQISQWADSAAPDANTMWHVGPFNALYIPYTSRMMPPHPIYQAWEMDIPVRQQLYGTPESILNDYSDLPPDVILVHSGWHSWLSPMTPKLEETLPLHARVLRATLKRHSYSLQAKYQDYILLRRRDTAGPS